MKLSSLLQVAIAYCVIVQSSALIAQTPLSSRPASSSLSALGGGFYYYYPAEGESVTFTDTYNWPIPTDFVEIRTVSVPSWATFPWASGYPPISTTFAGTPGNCDAGEYVVRALRYNNYIYTLYTNTYTIVVDNVNRPPFFISNLIADTTIHFGNSLPVTITASDSDCVQCGDDTLSMTYIADPPSAAIIFSDLGNGNATFDWTPAIADSGLHVITFTVSDRYDSSATQTMNVMVRVNHAPAITSAVPSTRTLRVGQVFSLEITASDYDITQFGDDTLQMTYSSVPPSASITFTDHSDGTASFSFTPSSADLGTRTVTFKATDLAGLFDNKSTAISVYQCGDANGDAAVNISDAVSLIAYIFAGGSAPSPLAAGDANCDAAVNISDAVYLIAYIFAAGPAPCAGCL